MTQGSGVRLSEEERGNSPISDLRYVRRLCVADGAPAALRVVHSIDLIIEARAPADKALNLTSTSVSADRLKRRRQALKELALVHFPHVLGEERAKQIDKAGRDYKQFRWPKDQKTGIRPDGHDGLFHDLMVCGGLYAMTTIKSYVGYLSREEISDPSANLIPEEI